MHGAPAAPGFSAHALALPPPCAAPPPLPPHCAPARGPAPQPRVAPSGSVGSGCAPLLAPAAAPGVASELDAVFEGDPALSSFALAVPSEQEVAAFKAWAARLRPDCVYDELEGGGGGGGVSAADAVAVLSELGAYPASMRLLAASGMAHAVAALARCAGPPRVRATAGSVAAKWRAQAAGALAAASAALGDGFGAAGGAWGGAGAWGLTTGGGAF